MITLASRSWSGRRKPRWSWKSGMPDRMSSWIKPKPITGIVFVEVDRKDTRNDESEGKLIFQLMKKHIYSLFLDKKSQDGDGGY